MIPERARAGAAVSHSLGPEDAAAEATAARPRLLFLCQTLPFPPDGGVSIRTYNILRLLSRTFEITALCFYRAKERSSPEQVQQSLRGLAECARIEAFPIPQEHSRIRLAVDHLRSIVRNRVYTVYAYESQTFRARFEHLIETSSFDLVHLDSLDLAPYLPQLQDLPVACVHHNVESELLRRRAQTEKSRLVRRYLRHQAKLMADLEREWCPRVSLNVMVSTQDRDHLAGAVSDARFTVVPNGVDTRGAQRTGGEKDGVVFVGGANWFPNRDAMSYFCQEILPVLRARGVGAPVRWVGRASAEMRREFQERYGIDMTGYVADARPLIDGAACYIVPLRVGGGTRLKILDAWAHGKAVVSTSVGCEGLDARNGENILIRDTPEQFARAVQLVLQDEALRRRLAADARRTAEAVYDWEVIGKELLRAYTRLIPTTSL